MAIRVAITMDELLAGQWLSARDPGLRAPQEDFADEETMQAKVTKLREPCRSVTCRDRTYFMADRTHFMAALPTLRAGSRLAMTSDARTVLPGHAVTYHNMRVKDGELSTGAVTRIRAVLMAHGVGAKCDLDVIVADLVRAILTPILP